MPTHRKPDATHNPERLRCRHILTGGNRCGSPCLRNELFCYYHHTTRIPVTEPKARLTRASLLFLPNPEDRASIQTAVSQVMHAIAHNNVDLKRAGLLLYSLQIATSALPPQPHPTAAQAKLAAENPIPAEGPVEDVEFHESYGLIAEPAPYGLTPAQEKAHRRQEKKNKPHRKKSCAQRLWEEIEAHEKIMMKRNAERREQARLAELAETAANDSTEAEPIPLPLPEPQLPKPQLAVECDPTEPEWLLSSSHSQLDEQTITELCKSLNPLEEGFKEVLEDIFPYATDRLSLYEAALRRDYGPPDVIDNLSASAHPQNPGAPHLDSEMWVPTHHPAAAPTPTAPSTPHRNSRRLRPTVDILGSCGTARSSAVRASSATSRRIHRRSAAPARLVLNEQHPRDHRISGRRQEALAPPT